MAEAETESDVSMDEEDIIRDFDAEAQLIVEKDSLPKKSGDRYTLVYETYKKCQFEHKNSLSNSAENNFRCDMWSYDRERQNKEQSLATLL